MDEITYIRDRLSQSEPLAQLAEEAAELAQAALKVRRVLDGTNPTTKDPIAAWDNLFEEVADVLLCISVVGIDAESPFIKRHFNNKRTRWVHRLMEAERAVNGG